MDIWRIINSVLRRWWLIVILTVFLGIIGYFINIYSAQTIYSANTTMYVLNKDRVEGQTLSSSDLYVSQSLITQYSGIFYSRAVSTAAAEELNMYHISDKMLASMVSISSEKNSNILVVTAVSPDPNLAAAAANAMSNEFILLIKDITKSDFIGIIDEAQVPAIPDNNNGLLKTLLFVFGGIVIALGIIYLLEYFDTTIRSSEIIEENLKLRVIGIIPEHDIS
ncbi:Wzz/FepE/Etk N-terminal domain-containing protein [Dehalobacter sp. TeCB1]|uniref:YveK family protein n=1 Tax=Dehalobacter sp. TeCB1 TaxID=1843715 RepID=UPI00083AD245|nr:Wzz/FepE/Etk N-terminal domain-containing protein [Dehalobacter sp. TeCB1]OCZ49455.1 lipopolysaccharide biosynthesis protein [Dehalobacter sp. TeCB1]